MANRLGACLATLMIGLAATGGTAWAQAPQEPKPLSATSWLVLLFLFLPFILIVFLLLPTLRRAKRNMSQIDRSLAMNEENLRLAREQVALQNETNRLLQKLLEALGHR